MDGEVAVVIPAFGAAATIGTALASVAAQTRPATSVVVVDDGSGDETAAAARRWSDLLPLRVIEQANAGPAAARRAAIAASDEPLVALLDADDAWLPDHLATLVALEPGRGRMATSRPLLWVPGRRAVVGPVPTLPAPADQRRRILEENVVFVGSLFSRADHDRAGGFRDGFTAAEDWDLWIRMLRGGVEVVRADHPTYLYRIADGSLSTGAGVHHTYLAVAEAARREETDGVLRSVLDRRVRWHRHRVALADALVAADEGAGWRARRLSLRAVAGGPSVALRALIVAMAPRRGSRLVRRLAAR